MKRDENVCPRCKEKEKFRYSIGYMSPDGTGDGFDFYFPKKISPEEFKQYCYTAYKNILLGGEIEICSITEASQGNINKIMGYDFFPKIVEEMKKFGFDPVEPTEYAAQHTFSYKQSLHEMDDFYFSGDRTLLKFLGEDVKGIVEKGKKDYEDMVREHGGDDEEKEGSK